MVRKNIKRIIYSAFFLISFLLITQGQTQAQVQSQSKIQTQTQAQAPTQAQPQSKGKTITIQNENISLKDVFMQIEQQTEYTIAYELSTIDLNRKIALTLKNADINTALNQALKGLACTYKVKGYHIIISLLPKETETKPSAEKKLTQTIRGVVIDSKTNVPIVFASVSLSGDAPIGTVSDSLGRFNLSKVPIGRYDLRVSFVGYHEKIVRGVLVTSSKEVYLEIALAENTHLLDEVVVTPDVDKDTPLNPMAITGGRMISMEEAGRFANGFDDPARMASAFAGVAGSIGTNAIAIRGNTPQFTQWRLEGIEIPNPTHFSDIMGLGGGFLSALSTQVMGNSDFYNGAFPAEYVNGLSGVFDTYMRNGNNQNHEHTFQIGMLGVDLASEGPLSKKHRSSYIFNYRFSTTTLATAGDANMKYQDLAFKLNFPTRHFGTFSIWGLGLFDRDQTKEEAKDTWETQADRQSGEDKQGKMSGGLTHKYTFNETTYLKSSLAGTYSNDKIYMEQRTTNDRIIPIADVRNRKFDFIFNAYLNKKFSARHVNRTGFTFTRLNYDIDYKISPEFGLDVPMEQTAKGDGNSSVISAFTTSMINLIPKLSASIGLTTQYFALNDNWTIEPRASLKWQFKPRQSLSAAYGLHSRRERLDYYYVEKFVNGKNETNKYLDFSKAHHFGISYDWNITLIHHLKVEPYFQSLYDIPVEAGTSFSIINQAEIYLDRILENKGAGKNYGIDITFEQYMNKGFYYMLTTSLFKSRYKGGDHIWRDTRYDRGFIFNFVTGKEWVVGKQNQNTFGLNTRIFFHGGERYSPIDEQASALEHDIVFDDTKAFTKKFNPSINGDVSVSYRINKRKLSHEFALKILNVGGYTGAHFYEYNEKTNQIKKEKGIGIIPNLSYKIYF